MNLPTFDYKQIKLKWLPLAWFGLAFTFLIFMILGMVALGNPNKIIMGWGLFGDVATFAIGLWDLGMILTVILLAILLRRNNLSLGKIGLKGSLSPKAIIYALLGTVIYFGIYYLTEIALAPLGITMFWRGGSNANLLSAQTTLDWLILFIGPVIISPITEELVFRGFVLTSLLSRLKIMSAVIISALIFASVHIMIGPGLMIYIFLGSFIFAYLFIKFGNLYPCMLMHFLTNLWAYILVPILFM